MKLAQQGFRVILGARNLARLAQLAEEIKNATGRIAETAQIDAGNFQQFVELKNRISEVDALHFNAAIVHAQAMAEAIYQDIEKDIAVGVSGAYGILLF